MKREERNHLVATAYDLASFPRPLALPRLVRTGMLTTLWEKSISIGAKAVSHAKAVTRLLASEARALRGC